MLLLHASSRPVTASRHLVPASRRSPRVSGVDHGMSFTGTPPPRLIPPPPPHIPPLDTNVSSNQYPGKHGTQTNLGLTLAHRRRRWVNVMPALVQCFVSVGNMGRYASLIHNIYIAADPTPVHVDHVAHACHCIVRPRIENHDGTHKFFKPMLFQHFASVPLPQHCHLFLH